MSKVLITNNELMNEAMNGKSIFDEVVYHSGSMMDVLKRAKEYIRKGYRLMTSPFTGNLPVYERPFRTLILEKSDDAVDFFSLNALNTALQEIDTETSARPRSLWSHSDLADFRKNDLVMIERWLIKIYYKNYWGTYGQADGHADGKTE